MDLINIEMRQRPKIVLNQFWYYLAPKFDNLLEGSFLGVSEGPEIIFF